jgi:hypothetical protein
MSFIGSAVKSIGQAIGIVPEDPKPIPVATTAATTAPTLSDPNTADATNAAEQSIAASMSRGRTSTMLTGAQGETDDQKYTSKILLGQ